ncbi:hypothetical protein NST50_13870 [Paenibacillus sp. FSL E2-0202]|uniref:hypothetical protein n=1 Tax=Paenibacillus sp. FSL E2-0202 TaxID=2954505 RepID=UPI0030ED46F8
MVIINFLDGTHLIIEKETILNGYKNLESDKETEFYLEEVFSDNIDGLISKKASKLSSTNLKVGIVGFILSVDCFTVGHDTENSPIYLSNSVKSVENSTGNHVALPQIHGIPMKKH